MGLLGTRAVGGSALREYTNNFSADGDKFYMPGMLPVGIVTYPLFAPTVLSFQVSLDGATFVPLYNNAGVIVTVPCAPSQYIALDLNLFWGIEALRVMSGSSQGAITANINLTVVARAGDRL
jgi:hypothetical protein